MSNARKAALHLLNTDWSRGVWKQWLSNIFQPPVEPPMPSPSANAAASTAENANAQAVSTPRPVTVTPPPGASAQSVGRGDVTCVEPQADAALDAPDSANARDVRRSELRARFDAISDRLLSVEDGLDTLLRRSAQRDKLGRRADQQSVEAIDNVALAGERQATVLEGLLNTVSRLEHAVARLESGLVRVERALGERRRDSHIPSQPPRASASQFPESQLAPRDRAPFASRASDIDDMDGGEGAGINGYLTDMSLSTVMAMLEIERHSGRLKVATDDGRLASFELADGSVVSSRLSENDADPLQTLRTALCWKQGRFWFRQQPAETPSSPPRSIGSLLLEATRQNDESFADVG
jgi:hypothetical protein